MNNYIERLLEKLKNSDFLTFVSSKIEQSKEDSKNELMESQKPIIPILQIEEQEEENIRALAVTESIDENIIIDGLNFCTIVGKEYLEGVAKLK
ncbi:hypothetical protein CBR56_28800 [Bacillus thuringiensis]|uniref:hypothetical protein n=1 Tax=Bacillus tropicus TaxID=2026188 RepID=UPI000B4534D6|nr:hypothetical protein [Bacillus tropicus]MED3039218.1 hypothetical protein [Bacillus tropicus]OTX84328.1 hypothetical protein BK728_13105 [Bacillus thuringiensis serovar chanpaisis]PNK22687.1 hypothetical protein CBR56_28800 [Bacillus thuringiensis]